MRKNIHCLLILWVLGLVSACNNGGDATSNSGKLPAAESDPLKSFISETEPENAVPLQTVIDAKTFGSEITVIGKVGDMQNHLAAFRLVDLQYQD